MKKILILFVLFLFSCSNNKIETNDSLKTDDIKYIRDLGLLDSGEKIIQFYSEYKNSVAGNFYTNKRIAQYWIDENDDSKNMKNSALYNEVVKLEANYNPGALYSKYVLITKSDGSTFKVSVNGTKAEIENFVNGMDSAWKQNIGK